MAKSLIIVGAGITGLSAAYIAAKAGSRVMVLEASENIGGLLQTIDVNGGRLEYFYHHHFRADVEFQWLLKELRILEKLKFYPTTMGVYREGKLYPFNGPIDLLNFKPMSFFDKLRFGLTSLYLANFCDWKKCEGITCREWFRKWAGRTTSESLWEPMLKIKFGDYADQVPLSWMVGRLRQRLSSRKGAQEMLGYMEGSLRTLLISLEEKLRAMGVVFATKTPVEEIIFENGRAQGVRSEKNIFSADQLLFTTPTTVLAPLVEKINPAYAQSLKDIEYFGALCVIVETSRALSDTYWLNVADAGFPFGGVIEHTNLVPKENFGGRHVTYLSRYFELKNALATKTDDEIIKEFLAGLKKLYPTLRDDEILRARVFRTRSAATVCGLNFSQKVPAYLSPIQGLSVASMPHIYPDERSCNNSIRVAANALKAMCYDTSAVPQGTTLAGFLGK